MNSSENWLALFGLVFQWVVLGVGFLPSEKALSAFLADELRKK